MATILEIQDLARHFGGVRALDGVDLKVESGEILGLIGPNGSGKTTLFNVVSGLLPPTRGKVIWKGRDVSRKPPHTLCRLGLSRTFQQTMTFKDLTVADNIRTALTHSRLSFTSEVEEVERILRFVDLWEENQVLARSLPYGHSRRLGVAMALATGPDLILLDEPAAGLSDQETQDFSILLKGIKKDGVDVWVIDHHMSFIMGLCDRIIVLSAGRKIAEGTPDEVSSDDRVIDVYLGQEYASRR